MCCRASPPAQAGARGKRAEHSALAYGRYSGCSERAAVFGLAQRAAAGKGALSEG
jgi:hypothetical protein